jgi:hypothetical protein
MCLLCSKLFSNASQGVENNVTFFTMPSKRRTIDLEPTFPIIVCLCGSTRFWREFQQINLQETLAGKIVLSIANVASSDAELFAGLSEQERKHVVKTLDELYFRKIELADEVLIINKEGYVGEFTKRELEYAQCLGKVIRWLEPNQENATLSHANTKP